jgi:hypothetical protein
MQITWHAGFLPTLFLLEHQESNRLKKLRLGVHAMAPALEEICWSACVSTKLAGKSWEALEKWLQILLADSVALRSKG